MREDILKMRERGVQMRHFRAIAQDLAALFVDFFVLAGDRGELESADPKQLRTRGGEGAKRGGKLLERGRLASIMRKCKLPKSSLGVN